MYTIKHMSMSHIVVYAHHPAYAYTLYGRLCILSSIYFCFIWSILYNIKHMLNSHIVYYERYQVYS